MQLRQGQNKHDKVDRALDQGSGADPPSALERLLFGDSRPQRPANRKDQLKKEENDEMPQRQVYQNPPVRIDQNEGSKAAQGRSQPNREKRGQQRGAERRQNK